MREIDPKETSRAAAFELWMKAPMPMRTLIKTLDVTNLVRFSRRRGMKLNMLMCWCIGKAAAQLPEFFLLPVGEKLIEYDHLALNTVVTTKDGGINTCDVPFSPDLSQFNASYLALTKRVSDTCEAYDLEEGYMVIGTSAMVESELDGAINIYAGCFNNPFVLWGKYRKKWWKATLPVSFQFHHTQMDGGQGAKFLALLQREINALGK